jgi:hypothetical protein
VAIHGKATGVILGGYDLTFMLNKINTSQSVDANESTPFQAPGGAKTFLPGLSDGTVSMDGMYEADADATELFLDVVASTADAVIVTYGKVLAFGNEVKFGSVIRSAFEVMSPVGDIVSITGKAQVTGGLLTGKVAAAKTVVASTPTNGTAVDNGAGTTAGGKAVLSVIANDRDGAVTVKVQHSSDNSTWIDKGTFTVIPSLGLGSEVIDLPGSISRYLRAVVTLAGSTGSATVTVALSRG